jgi:hypothetical protein
MSHVVRGRFTALLIASSILTVAWPALADDVKDSGEKDATEAPDKAETPDKVETPDKAPDHTQASVTVLPYTPLFGQVPQSTADKISSLLQDEFVKANEFKYLEAKTGEKPAVKKVGEVDVAKAKTEIASATALFEKAKQLADKRKIKPAQDSLEKGIALFTSNFVGADDFKPLSDAYLLLASTRFLLGNDDGATKALDDMIRIDPTRTLSTPAVSSDIAEKHAKERVALFARSRGDVKIESAPAGARVTLDGKTIGETPLLARSILPGEHYLRVAKEGAGVFAKKLSIGSNAIAVSATLTVEATGTMATLTKNLSQNVVDATTLNAAQQLGTTSAADYVLIGGIRQEGDSFSVKSYALRVKDGAIAELTGISIDSGLISASIEVLKITTDLSGKVQSDTFTPPPNGLTLFDGVTAPKAGALALTEVVVTSDVVDGQKPSENDAAGAARPSTSRRPVRGPVTSETQKPAEPQTAPVVTAPTVKAEETGETALETLERRRRENRKPRGRAIVPTPEPSKDDQGANDPDVTETPDPSKSVKLDVPGNTSSGSLTPEQLMKLSQPEEPKSNTGKIVLWTSVGAVGAAAIATGAYFLFFRSTTPSAATATIKWQ